MVNLGNLPRLLGSHYSGNMGLRCFLFTSDEGSAETIGQVLATLDVQAESCPEAVAAADKIAHEPYQIVIIDWDKQPESGLLLTTARERKAAERPITLAIVSDDASVPKALQAGANSILRRPLVFNQIKDTLTTARDLVRSRNGASPATRTARPLASAPAPLPAMETKAESPLRAGEFLQSAPASPGGSFVTESDVPSSLEHQAEDALDPLKELEPVASAVPAPPPPGEPKGLQWYLKAKGITPGAAAAAPAPAPSTGKPEMLGYDQTPSFSSSVTFQPGAPAKPDSSHDHKKEDELFAYIDGEKPEEDGARPRFRLGKGAIFTALLLASIAIAAAPQAPWHSQLRAQWSRGQRSLHAWLNPQPVTPPQAPVSHETFARPGDEYRLPVAETIPDATTDPSQVQVLPVVDPTAKKPNPDAANPDLSLGQTNPQAPPSDATSTAPVQVLEQPSGKTPDTNPAAPATVISSGNPTVSSPAPAAPVNTQPAPSPAPKYPPYRPPNMPSSIPQSLKSQMAPNTPDPGGTKAAETALPSIEPVSVPESAERPLLIDQPPIPYPSNAKGQRGTVVLQVLIGRDGTVQDAKFLQGSLVFARTAIDGAKKWKFKPYMLNGRPVSVQTTLSITVDPSS